MPSRANHTPQGDRPAAERPFIDRDEFIGPVSSALKEPQRTKPLVLVYYGGAGIGKSRLRRELVKQFGSDPGVVTATLDFDIPIYRQPDAALFFLRNSIREAYTAEFPSFDVAYAVLWQKAHPDAPLRSEKGGVVQPPTHTGTTSERWTMNEERRTSVLPSFAACSCWRKLQTSSLEPQAC